MSIALNILNQQNLGAPRPSASAEHTVIYSDLRQIEFRLSTGSFAIKYVHNGQENYRINGSDYAVRSGEYLLVNPECQGVGYVDQPARVQGICISISPKMMAEVASTLRQSDEPWVETQWSPLLGVSICPAKWIRNPGTGLGRLLGRLGQELSANQGPQEFSPAFFYTLCELYLGENREFSRQLKSIQAVKPTTRQELHRRLQAGKSILDDGFAQPLEIASVARNACMSEYQFFRLFKAVFGVTPYQYVLQKRLEWGCDLLKTGHFQVSDIALKTGFADIFSFSKAFKKQFGVAPSALLGAPAKKAGFDKYPTR